MTHGHAKTTNTMAACAARLLLARAASSTHLSQASPSKPAHCATTSTTHLWLTLRPGWYEHGVNDVHSPRSHPSWPSRCRRHVSCWQPGRLGPKLEMHCNRDVCPSAAAGYTPVTAGRLAPPDPVLGLRAGQVASDEAPAAGASDCAFTPACWAASTRSSPLSKGPRSIARIQRRTRHSAAAHNPYACHNPDESAQLILRLMMVMPDG
jgi:hypothetical protein